MLFLSSSFLLWVSIFLFLIIMTLSCGHFRSGLRECYQCFSSFFKRMSFGREKDWLHQTKSWPGSDFICRIPHHRGWCFRLRLWFHVLWFGNIVNQLYSKIKKKKKRITDMQAQLFNSSLHQTNKFQSQRILKEVWVLLFPTSREKNPFLCWREARAKLDVFLNVL